MRFVKQKLPLTYNFRSLLVRKGGSALTLASIALTVMVFTVMAGLSNGLEKTYSSTGRDNVLVALSKGANSAELSRLTTDSLFILKYNHAIRHRIDGSPLFSPEVYAIKPIVPPNEKGSARWLPIRGIRRENLDLYPQIKLIEGKTLEHSGDVLMGKLVSTKLGNLHVGDRFELGRQKHRIAGFFSSQGTAYESEIWALNEDLVLDFELPSQSIAVFALQDGAHPPDVIHEIQSDPRLQVDIKTEKEYFAAMAANYTFVRIIGTVISAIMSIGALFAGMNTMYASVSARIREIGTLRALGFSRESIQLSFIIEALILGGLSGVLGIAVALIFNGASLSFMRSAFHIQMTPLIIFEGLALALLVGLVGGYFPARNAARMKIVDVMNG